MIPATNTVPPALSSLLAGVTAFQTIAFAEPVPMQVPVIETPDRCLAWLELKVAERRYPVSSEWARAYARFSHTRAEKEIRTGRADRKPNSPHQLPGWETMVGAAAPHYRYAGDRGMEKRILEREAIRTYNGALASLNGKKGRACPDNADRFAYLMAVSAHSFLNVRMEAECARAAMAVVEKFCNNEVLRGHKFYPKIAELGAQTLYKEFFMVMEERRVVIEGLRKERLTHEEREMADRTLKIAQGLQAGAMELMAEGGIGEMRVVFHQGRGGVLMRNVHPDGTHRDFFQAIFTDGPARNDGTMPDLELYG